MGSIVILAIAVSLSALSITQGAHGGGGDGAVSRPGDAQSSRNTARAGAQTSSAISVPLPHGYLVRQLIIASGRLFIASLDVIRMNADTGTEQVMARGPALPAIEVEQGLAEGESALYRGSFYVLEPSSELSNGYSRLARVTRWPPGWTNRVTDAWRARNFTLIPTVETNAELEYRGGRACP